MNKKEFESLENKVFSDDSISFKAKGMMTHIYSHFGEETFCVKSFEGVSVDAYASISAGLDELVYSGYIEKLERLGVGGRRKYVIKKKVG